RYRVGIRGDKLSIGLPEVMLGIHPGFGGTVRSVRIAGVRTAMQMMLTGKTLRESQAKRAGFFDRVVFPSDGEAAGRELITPQPKARRPGLLDRLLSWAPIRPLVRRSLVAQVRARARPEHYPAPYAIIELWSQHGAHGSAAFAAEAHSIAELMVGETARNLVRVFMLQDRLKNLGGKAGVPLERVHVVGGGV